MIPDLLQLSTAPVWNSGITVRKTANNAVYNRVLKYAGARPTDRDSADKRIVAHVKNRNGEHHQLRGLERHHPLQQECRRLAVADAAHAPPHAAFESEHHGVEWLHQPRELAALMDQTLQGVTSSVSPTSPPSLSVQ